jgi:hypothetical protein
MRKLILVIVASVPTIVVASDTPSAFPDVKLEVPTFSLVGSAQQGIPSLVNDFRPIERIASIPEMPVLVPPTDCDPKMIAKPNSAIDYKLIVKDPENEAGK